MTMQDVSASVAQPSLITFSLAAELRGDTVARGVDRV